MYVPARAKGGRESIIATEKKTITHREAKTPLNPLLSRGNLYAKFSLKETAQSPSSPFKKGEFPSPCEGEGRVIPLCFNSECDKENSGGDRDLVEDLGEILDLPEPGDLLQLFGDNNGIP